MINDKKYDVPGKLVGDCFILDYFRKKSEMFPFGLALFSKFFLLIYSKTKGKIYKITSRVANLDIGATSIIKSKLKKII